MLANIFHATLTRLIPPHFSHEGSLPFLLIGTLTNSHQFLDGCSFSWVELKFYYSLSSLTKDYNHPSDLAALCPFRNSLSWIVSISHGEVMSIFTDSLTGILNVPARCTDRCLNCSFQLFGFLVHFAYTRFSLTTSPIQSLMFVAISARHSLFHFFAFLHLPLLAIVSQAPGSRRSRGLCGVRRGRSGIA